MDSCDIVVVGAGPAGMMAAGIAARQGKKVIIIEKNNKVGRKLLITGKGRCNITNNCDVDKFIDSIPSNGRFLYSAINNFTCQDTMGFFEENGLNVKVERGNRVFPESDKAMDVVDVMYNFIKHKNCRVVAETVTDLIIDDGEIRGILLSNGDSINSKAVIIACGGKSYPLTGSTGDGYKLAKQAGHTITKLKPSLVPLICSNDWCKELQGLSLKNVNIEVTDNEKNKVIYKDFGEMLFTHFGVSGPIILSSSSHMRNMEKNKYSIKIDLKPALDLKKLDSRLTRDFVKYQNKDLANSLGELLPRKLIPVIIRLSELDPQIKCNAITKEMRNKLAETIKNLKVDVANFRPIEEAIITSGGVRVSEISPKTMESKIVSGLYFAGEVIDVDAYTGGFNLQIAFSTGYLAGINASV